MPIEATLTCNGCNADSYRCALTCSGRSIRGFTAGPLHAPWHRTTSADPRSMTLDLGDQLNDAPDLLDLPLGQLRHEARAHNHRLLRQLPLAQHLHTTRRRLCRSMTLQGLGRQTGLLLAARAACHQHFICVPAAQSMWAGAQHESVHAGPHLGQAVLRDVNHDCLAGVASCCLPSLQHALPSKHRAIQDVTCSQHGPVPGLLAAWFGTIRHCEEAAMIIAEGRAARQ